LGQCTRSTSVKVYTHAVQVVICKRRACTLKSESGCRVVMAICVRITPRGTRRESGDACVVIHADAVVCDIADAAGAVESLAGGIVVPACSTSVTARRATGVPRLRDARVVVLAHTVDLVIAHGARTAVPEHERLSRERVYTHRRRVSRCRAGVGRAAVDVLTRAQHMLVAIGAHAVEPDVRCDIVDAHGFCVSSSFALLAPATGGPGARVDVRTYIGGRVTCVSRAREAQEAIVGRRGIEAASERVTAHAMRQASVVAGVEILARDAIKLPACAAAVTLVGVGRGQVVHAHRERVQQRAAGDARGTAGVEVTAAALFELVPLRSAA
jgi:hypothetical protein